MAWCPLVDSLKRFLKTPLKASRRTKYLTNVGPQLNTKSCVRLAHVLYLCWEYKESSARRNK